ERTIVYEVTRDATGKEISRIEKSNTITKAPVTEVIAQGTKVKEPEEQSNGKRRKQSRVSGL
ncbi:G5 domain-containing protein, partial [Ligilactobacillus murinus]|uniref:G5 domain-containing protein n=1 Tax=Ligilactobacillus murinus TaxID=1622 RepID=UPI00113E1A5B